MLRPYKSTTIVTKHDFFLIHSLSIHPRLNHVCCMLLQCHQQFAMRSVCPPYRVTHHVAPILPLTLHLFKSFVGTHDSVKVENIGLSSRSFVLDFMFRHCWQIHRHARGFFISIMGLIDWKLVTNFSLDNFLGFFSLRLTSHARLCAVVCI